MRRVDKSLVVLIEMIFAAVYVVLLVVLAAVASEQPTCRAPGGLGAFVAAPAAPPMTTGVVHIPAESAE